MDLIKIIIKEEVDSYISGEKQKSDNEEIQLYVDIIDGLDNNNINRKKYIDLLKNKYNYDYIESDDEYHINNPNLKDIKSLNDFKSFSAYRQYAENILKLRENNIDYSKFFNYSPTSIPKNELISILERYKIKSYFTNNGAISSPKGNIDDMGINWAGDTIEKSHILHEVGHFFDKKIIIPITYSLTDYGLTNQAESTCDSIMLFLLNKEYYKTIFPEIGNYIEKNIPTWLFRLADEIISA